MGGVYYFVDKHGNKQKIYKLKPKVWKTSLDESLEFGSCKECYEFLFDNGFTEEKCFETEKYKKDRMEIMRILNRYAVDSKITDFEISVSGKETLLIFKSGNNMFSFAYPKSGVVKHREIAYYGDYSKLINFVKRVENIKDIIEAYSILFDRIVLIYKNAVKAA